MNRFFLTYKKRQLRLLRQLDKLRGMQPPQIVFMHIPKCAGSSVNLHFKANIGHSFLLQSINDGTQNQANIKRAMQADFVGGHFGFDALLQVKRPENSVAFVFLREPMARLKSLYFYCRSQPLETNVLDFPYQQARQMSFLEFCLSDDPAIRMVTDNAQARTLAKDYMLPTSAWNSEEELVASAKKHLAMFDYIGLTENISADLRALAVLTKTRLLADSINKNPTRSAEYEAAKELLAEEKEQIAPLIHLDQIIYDYAKDLRALKD